MTPEELERRYPRLDDGPSDSGDFLGVTPADYREMVAEVTAQQQKAEQPKPKPVKRTTKAKH